jgi:aminopeptidase
MYDPRFARMAQVIVRYSLDVKPGQWVYIWSATPAAPLMLEIYREVLNVGANAFLRADLPGAQEVFFAHADGAQLDQPSPIDQVSVEEGKFDAYIRIGAESNTRKLSGADPAKVQRHQAAMGPILNQRLARSAKGNYNWLVTLFPTDAFAMDADMSLSEFAEFVFAACMVNDADPVARWREFKDRQDRYVSFLSGKRDLTLRGENFDLKMRIDGRRFINSHGLRNFPDGEIYTGPVEDSVNGWIRYTYPAIYQGREVSGIELTFADGKVTQATAQKNKDFLNRILDTDPGARYLGEFAIGTNYGINRFSRNILFDEKIGGTIHMAVGRSYEQTGGLNQSSVHWDMIAGAQQCEIAADGEVFYKDGQFLI